MKCPDCDVAWNEFLEGKKCWFCGVEPPPADVKTGVAWPAFIIGDQARAHNQERGDEQPEQTERNGRGD